MEVAEPRLLGRVRADRHGRRLRDLDDRTAGRPEFADQVAHGLDGPTRRDARGVRPDDDRLDRPVGSVGGRAPGGDRIVRDERPATVGHRLETGVDLRGDHRVEDRLARRVDGQRRPGQGSEQRPEHGR